MKIDYLHYDLGDAELYRRRPTAPGVAFTASNKFSGDIVRGGINYRFNWTLWDLILRPPLSTFHIAVNAASYA